MNLNSTNLLKSEDEKETEEKAPNILEELKNGNFIQKKFLETRKIFLWGPVMDESAKEIVNKLMYLEMIDPGKEITFYINSPGGVITSGMTIYDTMKMISLLQFVWEWLPPWDHSYYALEKKVEDLFGPAEKL